MSALRMARSYGHRLGTATIRTTDGFRMELDLSDWVDQHIYAIGEYESDVVTVVKAALKKGMTAIDIGANVGFFSLLFSTIVGSGGKVLAFEPQPAAIKRLARNIELNPRLAIEVHNLAAADADGEISFYCGPVNHSGVASIRPRKDDQDAIIVRSARADDIIASALSVDLIKIDVEGAETRVIAGLENTIKRSHPHIIVEVSDLYLREMGSSGQELVEKLCGYGYRAFQITSHGLVEVTTWSETLAEQFNALFTTNHSEFRPLIRL